MTTAAHRPRRVRCPQCSGLSLYSPENPWRPFCSERCKLIDLGQWATGAYSIPVEESDAGMTDAFDRSGD
jgi:endogenous inhibitor of DNA gyrase (YacG/DUF329 family)